MLRVPRRRLQGNVRRIRGGGLAQVRNRSVRRRRPDDNGTLVLPGRGVVRLPGPRGRGAGRLGRVLARGMSRAELPVAFPVAPLVLLSAVEDGLAARAPEQLVSSVADRADGHPRRRAADYRASITFAARGSRVTDGDGRCWRRRRHRPTSRSRVLLTSLRQRRRVARHFFDDEEESNTRRQPLRSAPLDGIPFLPFIRFALPPFSVAASLTGASGQEEHRRTPGYAVRHTSSRIGLSVFRL